MNEKKLKFGLIGVGGFVAPRHLNAIKETGNTLCVCCDPNDSVGVIDGYFPQTDYFQSYERFEREISKRNSVPETKLDYFTICTPNYLHDTHTRLALANGSNAVCEKPMALFPSNLNLLEEAEEKSGCKIFTVMQLRYHPQLIELKNKIGSSSDHYKVKLNYITPRGKWYHYSWKGNEEKSGGLATNIGIHLFDLLIWLFGNVIESKVILKCNDKIKGLLVLDRAEVEWFLSINQADMPNDSLKNSFRSLEINGEQIEFSEGFTDLHTKVYQEIFAGRGLRIKDARPSIELVYNLRKLET